LHFRYPLSEQLDLVPYTAQSETAVAQSDDCQSKAEGVADETDGLQSHDEEQHNRYWDENADQSPQGLLLLVGDGGGLALVYLLVEMFVSHDFKFLSLLSPSGHLSLLTAHVSCKEHLADAIVYDFSCEMLFDGAPVCVPGHIHYFLDAEKVVIWKTIVQDLQVVPISVLFSCHC
jgi:hypothetical protein